MSLTPSELKRLKATYRLLRRKCRDTKAFSYSGLFQYLRIAIEVQERLIKR